MMTKQNLRSEAPAIDSREKTSGESFVMTRVIKAPRELLFKVCTEREHLAHWWGPKGFALDIAKFEPRPGGTFVFKMSAANGMEMWGKWIIREMKAPERLVFVSSFSDPDGGTTRHPMAPEWPLETLSTWTFEDLGGKTKLTIKGETISASDVEQKTFEDGFESMKGGNTGMLDNLEEYLKTVS